MLLYRPKQERYIFIIQKTHYYLLCQVLEAERIIMKIANVRLSGLEMENLKNVNYGKVSFVNARKSFKASVLGLYGQNGSGKTALIDAVLLLKYALIGQPVPAYFADYVNVDADSATLRYDLTVVNGEGKSYLVTYELSVSKNTDVLLQSPGLFHPGELFKTLIFDEKLSYPCRCANGKEIMQTVIDTRNTDSFGPASKLEVLTNGNKAVLNDLIVARKLTAAMSRSYCFSRELLDIIRKNCQDRHHLDIFNALVNYGNTELFVIKTNNTGLISLDALPLAFKYEEKNTKAIGNLAIALNGTTHVPRNVYNLVLKVFDDMNIVLKKIVPGLTISVKKLGEQVLEDGADGVKIQLMSQKNSKEIPLQYESEGIKKIVSILHLLIVIYNNASITVAVDELDSGIFEYLLGELLRIVSERGKGQLIFTSHNLRPLETLDRGFVAFTTSNPNNRYIRFTNVKNNNNLRDFYYRDIMLGEQNEIVYEPTHNEEISFAFRKAGELGGA